MSVVGIDFGTLHSKIGVARKRGVDIITNEVSNRQTPSLVAFGPKQRALGESAKTQETSNFRNTIGSLKRLVGRTVNDPEVQEVEKKFLNANLVDVDGSIGAQVRYLGEQQSFSATQLVGAYFGKLRDITAAELKTTPSDVVIAVPGWYTDVQRRAVLDAATIAGLNPLRLINDYAAVALGWGITKSDLPDEENPRNVMFVDVGHSTMSVSIVAFSKGKFVVKSAAFDSHIGGRDLDYALVSHFSEEFKGKYKIDVLSNPKATFRLQASCEKLKKVLSANSEAPLNVESIMNDIDASSKLTRDQLEELVAPVLDRVQAPIVQALADSGLTLEDIDAVELIGGSTRVPAVRSRIQAAVGGKTLSSTLNQDEAIARGATFACAMLSPVFKVREFAINDITNYPIKIRWDKVPGDDDETELEVYTRGSPIPSTKVLTFYRKDAFDLEAVYADSSLLPGGINPWIARFSAKAVEGAADATPIKVRVRLNAHGAFSFEQAYIETKEEKEEAVPAPAPAMDVDSEAPPPPPKKKFITRKKELQFITGTTSLDKSVVERYTQQEAEMHASDKLVLDTEDRKNALEEYIYDTRGKLDDRLAAFVKPEEKEKLLAALSEAEDWLYTEEGEVATKSVYVQRLDTLKVLGDPITNRYRESEERSKNVSALRDTINTYLAHAQGTDDKYAHIDASEKEKVIERCATIQHWLDNQVARQSERAKNVDPVLTGSELNAKRDEIIYFATPILSKPKPKPVPEAGAKQDAPKEGAKTEEPVPEKAEDQGPPEMDVD